MTTNKFLVAQLVHKNKPYIVTGLSSSVVVFQKEIKDLLLFASGKRQISTKWNELMKHMEIGHSV